MEGRPSPERKIGVRVLADVLKERAHVYNKYLIAGRNQLREASKNPPGFPP